MLILQEDFSAFQAAVAHSTGTLVGALSINDILTADMPSALICLTPAQTRSSTLFLC